MIVPLDTVQTIQAGKNAQLSRNQPSQECPRQIAEHHRLVLINQQTLSCFSPSPHPTPLRSFKQSDDCNVLSYIASTLVEMEDVHGNSWAKVQSRLQHLKDTLRFLSWPLKKNELSSVILTPEGLNCLWHGVTRLLLYWIVMNADLILRTFLSCR